MDPDGIIRIARGRMIAILGPQPEIVVIRTSPTGHLHPKVAVADSGATGADIRETVATLVAEDKDSRAAEGRIAGAVVEAC